MAFCIGITDFDTYHGIDPNLAKLREMEEKKIVGKKSKNKNSSKNSNKKNSRVFLDYSKVAIEKQRIIFQTRHHLHEDCPICLGDMYGKSVKYLPCGHTFCSTCIQEQFESNCPSKCKCASCRYDLTSCLIRQQCFRENMQTFLGTRRVDYEHYLLDAINSIYNEMSNINYNDAMYGLTFINNNNNNTNTPYSEDRVIHSVARLIAIILTEQNNNISQNESIIHHFINDVINNANEYNNLTRSLEGGQLAIDILTSSNTSQYIINTIIDNLNNGIIDNLANEQL